MIEFWCGKTYSAVEMSEWVNERLTEGWQIESATAAGNSTGVYFVVYMTKEVSNEG